MHSRMRPKYKPTINGKEVDLDLLYQIVTSHGGWEKVNLRNEWDDLLEHFHLPRGTNGGLVIKQIYLKYLEKYEKVYFLGEDGGGHKDEGENDYDDIRNRRRTASKMTSRSSTAASFAATPSASSSALTPAHQPGQGQPQSILNPLSDAMREQLGLPKKNMTDYDKLVLSLQSPLPNEQDMAISVCTLLCNETKHVIRLAKCPDLVTYLVAHTGIYRDCGLRMTMEETYTKGRNMDLFKFWEEMTLNPDVRQLICESYVKRIQDTLSMEELEEQDHQQALSSSSSSSRNNSSKNSEGGDDIQQEDVNISALLVEEGVMDPPSTISTTTEPSSTRPSSPPMAALIVADPSVQNCSKVLKRPTSPTSCMVVDSGSVEIDADINKVEHRQLCCHSCPCAKMIRVKGSGSSQIMNMSVAELEEYTYFNFVPPPTLARSHHSHDKESKRVHQVALILRNLSFEDDNAEIMAQNVTMLRFLILTSNCTFGSLMHNSLDTISNVAKYYSLEDPGKDPISSLLLSSIISGLFSADRMKVICSLEAIRNLTRTERNEKILANLIEKKVCDRLCELLTLCDIMMLIYTLECIHAISGIGESVCNEIVRVKGAVASFIALVTVEAQSYGPKGCIQMRVVETVTGGGNSAGVHGSTTTTTTSSATNSPSTGLSTPRPSLTSSVTVNSIQAIGLRTVSGQTVVPPQTPQQPHHHQQQQQQQQQPTAASFANSPSPLCGTVAAISVVNPSHNHHHQQHQQQQHRPQQSQQVRISSQVMSMSSTPTSSLNLNPPSTPLTGSQQISGYQVLHPHSTSSPSLSSSPQASPQPPGARSSSPGPIIHTHIAQLQQGKTTTGSSSLPRSGPPSTPSATAAAANNNQNHDLHVTTTSSSSFSSNNNNSLMVNNIDHHGKSTAPLPPGALPQVSSQSLTQQVFYTPAYIKAGSGSGGETLSEEAWAKDWLNGGFEQLSGTSIEVGELYRMYSISRTRHYSNLLSQAELIKCVKLVYGASVGPVMKSFGAGATSLSFIDGIRPKINFQQDANANSSSSCVPGSQNSLPPPPLPVSQQTPLSNSQSLAPHPLPVSVSVATNGVINDGAHNNNNNNNISSNATVPVSSSAHGAAVGASPLSPILKATLSRPPTPKSPTGVAQRQQKKLQETKNSKNKGTNKGGGKDGAGINPIKMNGEASSLEKAGVGGGEESSASSSMNSIAEEILLEGKTEPCSLTFQGVLCNGSGGDIKEEEHGELTMEIEDQLVMAAAMTTTTTTTNNTLVKGMLVDLLERKVSHKETANGIVGGREIRISDKGLELIKNQNQNSSALVLDEGQQQQQNLLNDTLIGEPIDVNDTGGGAGGGQDEPQKMTFYASPEVVASVASELSSEQNEKCSTTLTFGDTTSTSDSTVLLSGGGGGGSEGQTSVIVVHQSDLEISGGGVDGGGDGASITLGEGLNNNIDSNGNDDDNVDDNVDDDDALSGVGNDLFEKFSQFSDLIVVNPAQLGMKRSASTENKEDARDNQPPPAKKIALCVNGNDDTLSGGGGGGGIPPPVSASSGGGGHCRVQVISSTVSTSSSGSVLHNALSSSSGKSSITPSSGSILEEGTSSSTTTTTIAVATTNSSGNPQMVHLPVRLVNTQNSQQISFAGRQMVIQPGQQIVLSSGGVGGSGVGGTSIGSHTTGTLQGQVIISKHQGGGSDGAVTKAYILIPQNQTNPGGGGINSIAGGGGQQQILQTISVSGDGSAVYSSPSSPSVPQYVNPVQAILNQYEGSSRDGIPPHLIAHLPPELLDSNLPYLCEWSGCGFRFLKHQQVFMHTVAAHCPETIGGDAIRCEWGASGCDPLMRKRFSIMTHLQDRHCNRQALELALYRRKNKIEAPPPPQQPIHHPGYAPNAAFHAIKRHALQYMNPKDLLEENEGPVTKSIRLTSALILRNLVNFSPQGRRMVSAHESLLSTIAMSSAESSRTLSQLLFDMNEAPE